MFYIIDKTKGKITTAEIIEEFFGYVVVNANGRKRKFQHPDSYGIYKELLMSGESNCIMIPEEINYIVGKGLDAVRERRDSVKVIKEITLDVFLKNVTTDSSWSFFEDEILHNLSVYHEAAKGIIQAAEYAKEGHKVQLMIIMRLLQMLPFMQYELLEQIKEEALLTEQLRGKFKFDLNKAENFLKPYWKNYLNNCAISEDQKNRFLDALLTKRFAQWFTDYCRTVFKIGYLYCNPNIPDEGPNDVDTSAKEQMRKSLIYYRENAIFLFNLDEGDLFAFADNNDTCIKHYRLHKFYYTNDSSWKADYISLDEEGKDDALFTTDNISQPVFKLASRFL